MVHDVKYKHWLAGVPQVRERQTDTNYYSYCLLVNNSWVSMCLFSCHIYNMSTTKSPSKFWDPTLKTRVTYPPSHPWGTWQGVMCPQEQLEDSSYAHDRDTHTSYHNSGVATWMIVGIGLVRRPSWKVELVFWAIFLLIHAGMGTRPFMLVWERDHSCWSGNRPDANWPELILERVVGTFWCRQSPTPGLEWGHL